MTREISAEGALNNVATLKGVSRGAALQAPRASLITKTWDTATTAHDLIREISGGYPVSIEVINWAIPAYRFGVNNMAPIDAIKQIAEAVGGVVDSLPDGTLRVRSKYPVPVPQWSIKSVDHELLEEGELFSSADQDTPVKVYNKFRVMDTQTTSGSDRLEYEEFDSRSGYVRAYPSPWRTAVTLATTAQGVTVGTSHEEYREEEETVEVYNGEASIRYPAVSVVSVVWLGADLLGVIAGNDSTKVTTTSETEKFSLLKIKYKTRCLVFPVAGAVGQEAQFLLKD